MKKINYIKKYESIPDFITEVRSVLESANVNDEDAKRLILKSLLVPNCYDGMDILTTAGCGYFCGGFRDSWIPDDLGIERFIDRILEISNE